MSRTTSPRKPTKPARPAPPAAKSGPFLRFHHSEKLRAQTLAVLAALEKSPDPEKHRGALADVVVELTETGMDAYFRKPLEQAGAGFIVEQSASLGIATASRIIGAAIRNVIGLLDAPQLLSVCRSIRQFMQ